MFLHLQKLAFNQRWKENNYVVQSESKQATFTLCFSNLSDKAYYNFPLSQPDKHTQAHTHFNMWKGAGIHRTTNLVISGQAALPPAFTYMFMHR